MNMNGIISIVPVIATNDIAGSLSHYIDVLGFARDFEWGDPVTYAGVKHGESEIYFTYDAGQALILKAADIHPEIFIWVSDAASTFLGHKTRGAQIIEDISDRPWGARQYVVRDINGFHLKFAQPL